MARIRRSVNFLFVILVLNFSKCILSQETDVSTNPSVTENNTSDKGPTTVIDEGGKVEISETPAEQETISNDFFRTGGPEISTEAPQGPEAAGDRLMTTTARIKVQTESEHLEGGESITQKSETVNEITQASPDSELTTLELQISISDGQCICGCNSGDNAKVECDTDSATAKSDSNGNDVVVETSPANVSSEPTTQAPIQEPCTEIGDFANPNDCKSYYSCIAGATPNDLLQRVEKTCPPKSAFSSALKRCSRDISSCLDDAIICTVSGNLPDPQSNSSYYWCADNFSGGFYKYHVECNPSEVFIPEIAKCFIDFQNIANFGLNFGNGPLGKKMPSDRDVVKAEWKLLKAQGKAKAKQLKMKMKYERKLQEEIEKKAMKDKKSKGAEEAKKFVCAEEGNFPSEFGTDRYFSCVNKKGKLKATTMFCGIGYSFDVNSQTCVLPSGATQPVKNYDDNSEDDDD